ncbi:MAG TPA: YceI family protein [Gemmatimonadaceae bacterium]|jgi:polyisoprenoid-binding protein YceI
MTVKSVLIALGVLASTGLAAGAQSKTAKAAKPAAAPANLHFTVAPAGNEARYRVREQLAGIDFPTDAVGVTHDITGSLVVQPNGTIIPDSSKIVVNIQNLKSDKSTRDRYLHTHSIEIDKYPTVMFAPKGFVGLNAKPGATAATFGMTGDLTVHGVTHPVTWQVNAHGDGDDILGTATTQFTFHDFGMEPPKKAILLSVMDTVKLEYDFHLVQAAVAANK